jgi:hypothetical protein
MRYVPGRERVPPERKKLSRATIAGSSRLRDRGAPLVFLLHDHPHRPTLLVKAHDAAKRGNR